MADLEADLGGVDELLTYMEIDPVAHTVAVVGANLHVRSGSGTTDDGGSPTGLGNLLIGYNEDDGFETRTGSHNLILGRYHSYTSYAGLVAGQDNILSGPYSSVTGGTGNEVSGVGTWIGGGSFNQATEAYATVAGGQLNAASGPYASVAGGHSNIASGSSAAVAGGQYNDAIGSGSTVAGGWQNEADGAWTAVGGGRLNSVSEYYATVPGNGLYCDENDNVGIGTLSPAYELDVDGDMRADGYY
ncbi:MAG: hypothetical protein QGH45_03035 [Myxococcota bacterium]|nr:hypothetical protein [Myxococcota bacterium]